MKIHISVPITIDMIIEVEDNFLTEDAVECVKSICFDDPSIVSKAIDETDEDISISRAET